MKNAFEIEPAVEFKDDCAFDRIAFELFERAIDRKRL
jgi:hypothetical protein